MPRSTVSSSVRALESFTRCYGYVRFFHPSTQSEGTDWTHVALAGAARFKQPMRSARLAQALQRYFALAAPALRVFQGKLAAGDRPNLKPAAGETALLTTHWAHTGVLLDPSIAPEDRVYDSVKIDTPVPSGTTAVLRRPSILPLSNGLSAYLPTELFVVRRDGRLTTLPAHTDADTRMPAQKTSARDAWLADIVVTWSVLTHFYPYFDAVTADWTEALRVALRETLTAINQRAAQRALSRMLAQLNDGHAVAFSRTRMRGTALFPPFDALALNASSTTNRRHRISTRKAGGYAMSPSELLLTKHPETRIVISAVDRRARKVLQPGDIIERVDGRDMSQRLAHEMAFKSAATDAHRRRAALDEIFGGSTRKTMRLTIKRGGARATTVRVPCVSSPVLLSDMRPPPVWQPAPGIWYIDTERVDARAFNALVPKLARATGIVFDVRGYPQDWFFFALGHLSDTPLESPHWLTPVVTLPDQRTMRFKRDREQIPPRAPRFRACSAFLTDVTAVSYAETCMGIVEAHRLGEIVGEPTAGTNGNINPFVTPSGLTVWWTGLRVLKHDETPHHGVGIHPTIPMSPTIAGLRAGRDEQLERALAAVGHKTHP
jgi:C-terminal processing protease CtpA/Prc